MSQFSDGSAPDGVIANSLPDVLDHFRRSALPTEYLEMYEQGLAMGKEITSSRSSGAFNQGPVGVE